MENNKVELIGFLGQDPDIRYLDNGKILASFTIANTTGSKENQKVNWFSIVAWGDMARIAEIQLRKGTKVGIEGKLGINTWKGKDGQTHNKIEITASKIEILNQKSNETL